MDSQLWVKKVTPGPWIHFDLLAPITRVDVIDG